VAADARIAFRVSPEVKARVRDLAGRQGVTESAFLKKLLSSVLYEPAPPKGPGDVPRSLPSGRATRLYLRLSTEDERLLRDRAGNRELAPATYAALLLRVHLRGAVPLPKVEYLALRQAVLELSAIGRNLNQIAKALHSDGKAAGPGRAEAHTMLKVAMGLKEHFTALLEANERSWKLSHAEGAR
jgi:Bacterial mobilisation protein (MobC)